MAIASKDTKLIRVSKKGAERYNTLLGRYAPRLQKAAFLEELCDVYEKTKKEKV